MIYLYYGKLQIKSFKSESLVWRVVSQMSFYDSTFCTCLFSDLNRNDQAVHLAAKPSIDSRELKSLRILSWIKIGSLNPVATCYHDQSLVGRLLADVVGYSSLMSICEPWRIVSCQAWSNGLSFWGTLQYCKSSSEEKNSQWPIALDLFAQMPLAAWWWNFQIW